MSFSFGSSSPITGKALRTKGFNGQANKRKHANTLSRVHKHDGAGVVGIVHGMCTVPAVMVQILHRHGGFAGYAWDDPAGALAYDAESSNQLPLPLLR